MEFNISVRGGRLPLAHKWLTPKYHGSGDFLVRSYSGGDAGNDPNNWRQDFPEYDYQYPDLLQIKKEINNSKKQLDKLSSNDLKQYAAITARTRLHDTLRGKRGKLAITYNAEVVTNAWMKMYEMMQSIDPILEKIAAKKTNKIFQSVHFAEAPGNFMLAINHYLTSNHPEIDWEWYANSYRDTGRKIYLEDNYGLMRKYPKKWWFGSDGDGDITSPDNIRSFAHQAERVGRFHLMTSDVKYVPPDVNYDEEEAINIPVHLGHVLCALVTLKKEGSMILKHLTLCESQTVSLLWILACCFQQLYIVKPETSKPANSEVYIVGHGYKKNITSIEINHLYNILRYCRYMNDGTGSPSIFLREDIPTEFVQMIVDAMIHIKDHQIAALNRDIAMYKKYRNSRYNKINQDMEDIRDKTADAWIEKQKIKPLPSNRKMLTF